MKIICTQAEKGLLLMTIADSENFCLFPHLNDMDCEIDCAKCCEKRIEWEIVEDDY